NIDEIIVTTRAPPNTAFPTRLQRLGNTIVGILRTLNSMTGAMTYLLYFIVLTNEITIVITGARIKYRGISHIGFPPNQSDMIFLFRFRTSRLHIIIPYNHTI